MATDPEKQQLPPPYPQQPPLSYPQGQPPPQAQTNIAVVTAPPAAVYMTTVQFRDFPVTVTDSNGQQVQTVLDYRLGGMNWFVACTTFWLTCWLGLCCLALIPLFIKNLKDVYHITPTDGKVVGVYRRM